MAKKLTAAQEVAAAKKQLLATQKKLKSSLVRESQLAESVQKLTDEKVELTNQPSELDTLTQLFTAKGVEYGLVNLKGFFEMILYEYYKEIEGSGIFGVFATVEKRDELEVSGYCKHYDRYVKQAKELDIDWGINLDFRVVGATKKFRDEYCPPEPVVDTEGEFTDVL